VDAAVETPAVEPVVETPKKAKQVAKTITGEPIPNGTKIVSGRYMDYRCNAEIVDGEYVFNGESYGHRPQKVAQAMTAAIRALLSIEESDDNKRGITGARFVAPEDVEGNADLRARVNEAAQNSTAGVTWTEDALVHDPAPVSERKSGSGNGRGRPFVLEGKTRQELAEKRGADEKVIANAQKRIALIDEALASMDAGSEG